MKALNWNKTAIQLASGMCLWAMSCYALYLLG